MSLYSFYNKWILPHVNNLRGANFVKRNLKDFALKRVESIPRLQREREGIGEREWENLIILDACRHDLFEEVIGDSDFRYCLGSSSPDFIEKNFSEGDWSDVVYVTANPHFDPSIFEDLTGRTPDDVFHEVFHTYRTDWDEDQKTIMPESVSRDAETAESLFPDKKLIVHFLQPHYPFLGSDLDESGVRMLQEGESGKTIWQRAEKGELEIDEIWSAYGKNLEIVMKEVRELDLTGKTVITADHGNLFGEGGLYGHPKNRDAKPLLKVPWKVLNQN